MANVLDPKTAALSASAVSSSKSLPVIDPGDTNKKRNMDDGNGTAVQKVIYFEHLLENLQFAFSLLRITVLCVKGIIEYYC